MNLTVEFLESQKKLPNPFWFIIAVIVAILITMTICLSMARAEETLKASWYSRASLVRDGQDRITHFIMANGKEFKDDQFTVATRLWPLGTWLRVSTLDGSKSVVVLVSDRIGKRFTKTRIDLSKSAFMEIADCKQGLVAVQVERIK